MKNIFSRQGSEKHPSRLFIFWLSVMEGWQVAMFFIGSRLSFWWYNIFMPVPKNEFHHSLSSSFRYRYTSNEKQRAAYDKNLLRRRQKAHELSLARKKNQP